MMRVLDHRRARQRDAKSVGRGIEDEVIVLEAAVLRARPVIDILTGEPGAPGRGVRVMDERVVEEALRGAAADALRQGQRGDWIAELLEELHRDAIGDAPAAAAKSEVAAFRLEIDVAMFHAELDAQGRIAGLEGGEPLHEPEAADRG